MKYILIDDFNNTRELKTEKELRDLYYQTMEVIIKNCEDEELLKDLKEEQDKVYICDFNKVKSVLEQENGFYKIEEKEVI